MTGFSLHPQLMADTSQVLELPLCRVLLMENAVFPWLILVPMRPGLRELFDLTPEDYAQCAQEVRQMARVLQNATSADKINVAALGNITPQLHIHVIARFVGDAAWPQPVWNSGVAPKPYTSDRRTDFISKIQQFTSKP